MIIAMFFRVFAPLTRKLDKYLIVRVLYRRVLSPSTRHMAEIRNCYLATAKDRIHLRKCDYGGTQATMRRWTSLSDTRL